MKTRDIASFSHIFAYRRQRCHRIRQYHFPDSPYYHRWCIRYHKLLQQVLVGCTVAVGYTAASALPYLVTVDSTAVMAVYILKTGVDCSFYNTYQYWSADTSFHQLCRFWNDMLSKVCRHFVFDII